MAASKSLSAAERRLRAQLAAHVRWSKEDPSTSTAKARAAFERKFLDEVDPDRTLPEPERLRRAQHAKSAHFKRMALASAKARRRSDS